MHKKNINTIYTIGHTTRSLEDFVELLRANKIDKLIDIRSFPSSRKYPQFNKESLATSLPQHGIMYEHKVDLGGRRKVQKDSKNNRWHNKSFRGYADYMETDKFEDAISDLEETASQTRVAIMCSEAVWWRCHRSMVADYLKAKGWDVEHIMTINKTEEHPYTSPAIVVGNKVIYHDKELFD